MYSGDYRSTLLNIIGASLTSATVFSIIMELILNPPNVGVSQVYVPYHETL
jgi:energy-converting hydrogenase Eha subunit E